MADCLECQRLRQKVKDLEWRLLSQADMWIRLKRYIFDLEQERRNGNQVKEVKR